MLGAQGEAHHYPRQEGPTFEESDEGSEDIEGKGEVVIGDGVLPGKEEHLREEKEGEESSPFILRELGIEEEQGQYTKAEVKDLSGIRPPQDQRDGIEHLHEEGKVRMVDEGDPINPVGFYV